MKKFFAFLMVLCLACVSVYAQEAKTEESSIIPEEKDWGISLSLTYANKYVTDAWVNTDGDMFFPDLTFSYKGAFAGVWGAFDMNKCNYDSDVAGMNIKHDFEEVDWYFGYGYTFEDIPVVSSISLTGTFYYYWYPHRLGDDRFGNGRADEDYSREKITFDVSTGSIADTGVSAGACLQWVYEHRAFCLSFYSSYDLPLAFISEKLTLGNRAELFIMDQRYASFKGAWGHLPNREGAAAFQYRASLNYQYNDYISFGPFASCFWQLENRARECTKTDGTGNYVFNTLFGFAFNASL